MMHFFTGNYPVSNPFGVYDPEAYANYPGGKHPGNDYPLPANTQLIAPISGWVTVYDRPASLKSGRGKEVVITNGAIERKACHMNRIDVQNGQFVQVLTPIGLSGNTGYVLPQPTPQTPHAGSHLHSEEKVNGVYVDEETYKEDEMPNSGDVHNRYQKAYGRPAKQSEIDFYTSRPFNAKDGLYNALLNDTENLAGQVKSLNKAQANITPTPLKPGVYQVGE
jgi:murein DD-endopeptidase MepM/ murein hydrolase activator NlpD